MGGKLISIFIFILLISISLSVVGFGSVSNNDKDISVENEIAEVEDKSLIFNDLIGSKHVKYWQHKINNHTIKGDSILLHSNPKTGDVLYFQKEWSEIPGKLAQSNNFDISVENTRWKQKVIFPDQESVVFSYTFQEPVEFPLKCLEVRFKNGSTFLYNVEGQKIGYDISMPVETGYALSGDCNDGQGDCWSQWRASASKWFNKWCDSIESVRFPTSTELREVLQDSDLHLFYELAHGDYRSFQCGREIDDYSRYHSAWLEEDMANRERMKFAFIGSCGGMTKTGDDSFSFEFRKGKMKGTVTIGYTHMPDYPGSFGDTLPWQETMFSCMDEGETIKESFDEACSYNPALRDHVVFVGDENLKVKDNPPLIPESPNGNIHFEVNESGEFKTDTYEPDGDSIYYQFDWDDGNTSSWIGPYESNTVVNCSYQWKNPGTYQVKVKAKDDCGFKSSWSDGLKVFVRTKPPSDPIINGSLNGEFGETYEYTFFSIDPENEKISYLIRWGDGDNTDWIGPYSSGEIIDIEHSYEEEGTYLIQAKAKDETGATSEWASLEVTMPKRKEINTLLLRFIDDCSTLISFLQHYFQSGI